MSDFAYGVIITIILGIAILVLVGWSMQETTRNAECAEVGYTDAVKTRYGWYCVGFDKETAQPYFVLYDKVIE